MKRLLLNFSEFNKRDQIFEAAGMESGDSEFILAYSNSSEKKSAEELVTVGSMMDPKKLEADINSLLARGRAGLAGFDSAWKKRISARLDDGPLTKKGEWYVGEGAWRINSAKANRLGMTPPSVQYFDPMQEELLKEYFPEFFEKGSATISSTGEIEDLDFSDVMPKKSELAMAESLKYIRKMYESEEEYSLGFTGKQASEVLYVDTKDLEKKLIANYNRPIRRNIMIWGAPAVAKTDTVKNVAKTIGAQIGKEIPVLIVTLATKAKYDISGLPTLYATNAQTSTVLGKELRGQVGMDFAYPAWLPGPDDEDEGIIFFDEINRADEDVLGSALTLILDRQSGSYKIPDGWRVWAAGNRDLDAAVTRFEPAIASRFLGGHFHLLPTVETWAEWARSDKAYAKGTREWYVPDELLSFFKLKDVVEATKGGGEEDVVTTRRGKKFRTKFNYFYSFDKSTAAETGTGQASGFPNPRTWSSACEAAYYIISDDPTLMSKSPKGIDPKKRVIALFGEALMDEELEAEIYETFQSIVGTTATDAFITFATGLAKLNDADGTLIEKIENIFTNPKAARPLINMPQLSGDEIFGVLTAIEGAFDNLVNEGKMKTPETFNWLKYCFEVEESGKVKRGLLISHMTSVIQKHVLYLKGIISPQNPDLTPDQKKIGAAFKTKFQEIGELIRSL